MDMYQEILAHAIWQHGAKVEIPGLNLSAQEIVDGTCYRALKTIRAILDNDSLDDPTCFKKIEAVVTLLGEYGIFTSRHDFG